MCTPMEASLVVMMMGKEGDGARGAEGKWRGERGRASLRRLCWGLCEAQRTETKARRHTEADADVADDTRGYGTHGARTRAGGPACVCACGVRSESNQELRCV